MDEWLARAEMCVAKIWKSATIQKSKEGISRYARGADQIEDYVQADFIIAGNDKGPRSAGLLHFDMTSLLPGPAIADLFKHTNQFSPGQRR